MADKEKVIDQGRNALANRWIKRIQSAERYWEKKLFSKIKRNQSYAKLGYDPELEELENPYVVNLVSRHIQNRTASLYAKNPKPETVLIPRLDYRFWDGTQDSKLLAQKEIEAAQMEGVQPDFEAMNIINDVNEAEEKKARLKRIGRTIEILLENAMLRNRFKERARRQVYRESIAGVAFFKYGYQTEVEINPDVEDSLRDARHRLAELERLREDKREGLIFEGDDEYEKLKQMEAHLENDLYEVIRQGLVVLFPRTENIIIDPDLEMYEGFIGARWMAERFNLTADEIERIYKVEITDSMIVTENISGVNTPHVNMNQTGKLAEEDELYAVYEVYDRDTGLKMVVADGYGFLVEPDKVSDEIEDVFPYVAIVTRDNDDDENPAPLSEVEIIRSAQDGYNASRQALEVHRENNKDRWLFDSQALDEDSAERIATMSPNTVESIRINSESKKLKDVLVPRPTTPIDWNLYGVEVYMDDITRVTGSPESTWGMGNSGTTATEATIANDSRSTSANAAIDKLDGCLSELMNRMARVAIRVMPFEEVKRIVGEGAEWPVDEEVKDILDQLMFTVKAGSSGKPNKSHELAKLERSMPILMQLPNIDPTRLAQAMLESLDSSYNAEDFIVPGTPSVMAQNGQAASANGGGQMNGPSAPQSAGGRQFLTDVQGNRQKAL